MDDTILSCFSDKPLSTYNLLVSSSFSIGVVFETVILLQVKSSIDNILGCLVSKSSIVIWFIDEIVLVVIPFLICYNINYYIRTCY